MSDFPEERYDVLRSLLSALVWVFGWLCESPWWTIV